MKQITALIVAAALLLAACGGSDSGSAESTSVRTIEQEHLPRDTVSRATSTDTESEAETDAVTLPFAPPISMDPVDGSKVSIRTTTPSTEFEGKIYHFNSEENRKLFVENPTRYLSGSLATY